MIGRRVVKSSFNTFIKGQNIGIRRGFAKQVTPEEQREAKAEIEGLMARSRAAQAQIADFNQEQVDNLIKAMVWSVCQPGRAEDIAKFTVP